MARHPAQIDKYPILGQVGEGGMGVIYKAEHPTLGRPVILKRLALTGGEGAVARFKREARIMMGFRNDAIVDVHDHFRAGGSWYIVMEYVDGPSLDALIKERGRLPNEAALLIVLECARALKYAHDKGVVHRDIKPSNILISRKGEVKLTDFGIATARDEEAATKLTSTGITLGTVAYMSPEQIESSRDVDKRADIYSLGVMLYEMVTGKAPYPSSFTPQTLAMIQRGKHRPVRRENPRTSPLVRRIIRKTMRPEPRKRFQDLSELLRLLERSLRVTDASSVQGILEAYLGGTAPPGVARRLGARVPALAAIGALSAAALFLDREGLVYELLFPQRYGALEVVVSGDTAAPPLVTIVREDSEAAAAAAVALQLRGGAWRSGRLYLPAAPYRVGVQAGGLVAWHRVRLEPRIRQRTEPSGRTGQLVTVDAGERLSARRFPLAVEIRVRDAQSGIDLTAATRVEVKIGDGWSPLSAETAARLVTGSTFEFRFERDGYRPVVQAVTAAPHQTQLVLEETLVPIPASIRVSTSLAGVRLLIDGSRWYERAGETPVRLPALGREPIDLTLAPGRHEVTAERRGSGSARIDVDVASGERVSITVETDGPKLALRRFP